MNEVYGSSPIQDAAQDVAELVSWKDKAITLGEVARIVREEGGMDDVTTEFIVHRLGTEAGLKDAAWAAFVKDAEGG